MKPQKLVVIGGIGAGKSYVIRRLKDHAKSRNFNIEVFSCDECAHEIRREKSDDLFNTFGTVDSRKLRDLVFSNSDLKKKLEDMIVPEIRSRMQDAALGSTADLFLAEAPTLSERPDWATGIITVEDPVVQRIRRVVDRDRTSDELAAKVIVAQSGQYERQQLADIILETEEQDVEHLDNQIYVLFATLRLMSK